MLPTPGGTWEKSRRNKTKKKQNYFVVKFCSKLVAGTQIYTSHHDDNVKCHTTHVAVHVPGWKCFSRAGSFQAGSIQNRNKQIRWQQQPKGSQEMVPVRDEVRPEAKHNAQVSNYHWKGEKC